MQPIKLEKIDHAPDNNLRTEDPDERRLIISLKAYELDKAPRIAQESEKIMDSRS